MNYLDIEPTTIVLEAPSHLNFPGVAASTADSICVFMGYEEEEKTYINFAVLEAVSNACTHGTSNDAHKRVTTRFDIWRDRLEVTVHDPGKGFDWEKGKAKVPESMDNYLEFSGRGIFMMQAGMDYVDFSFSADGTRCHLMKKLKTPLVMRKPALR